MCHSSLTVTVQPLIVLPPSFCTSVCTASSSSRVAPWVTLKLAYTGTQTILGSPRYPTQPETKSNIKLKLDHDHNKRICQINIESVSYAKCQYLLLNDDIDIIAVQETYCEIESVLTDTTHTTQPYQKQHRKRICHFCLYRERYTDYNYRNRSYQYIYFL